MTSLEQKFDEALTYASDLHRAQRRKSTDIPYVSHLMGVCSLVLEDGGDEAQAIAALLHDAAEDQGGEPVLVEIAERFGADVAEMVRGCSDTFETPKPAWCARKKRYMAMLREDDNAGTLRISIADKLHNARAIARDLRVEGPAVWERFSAGVDKQVWYYDSLLAIYREKSTSPMVDELSDTVRAIKQGAFGDPDRVIDDPCPAGTGPKKVFIKVTPESDSTEIAKQLIADLGRDQRGNHLVSAEGRQCHEDQREPRT